MVKIKICGIRRLEDIRMVNKYKPDYIGFVFAKSKRRVSHELAGQLKDNLDPDIISVGVFVNADLEEIMELFNDGIIEIAQLHGTESVEYINVLREKTNNELKIIKAIEITEDKDLDYYEDLPVDYLLLDSGKGSGKTFEWRLIDHDFKKEFFLAGGINSANIGEAIEYFNPYAIDLSSSLETDGFKDEEKIKEIMEVIN